MSGQTKGAGIMSVVKLSTASRKFLENNPAIAQVAGKSAFLIAQLKSALKEYDKMLIDVDFFEKLMQSGTKEELIRFLSDLNYAISNDEIQIFDNLPEGAYEKLVEKMGPETLHTDLKFHPAVVNMLTGSNKEV